MHPVKHTRVAIQRSLIMATLTDLIKSVKDLNEATTASAKEINDAVTEAEKDQQAKNKDYDDFKDLLVKGGLTEDAAKERLASYGLTKVTNMSAWKKAKADELEKSISAEKNKNFYSTVSQAVELAKIAAAVEAETTPKTPMEKMLEQQAVLMNQVLLNQSGYQAPAPQQTSSGVTWSANLLEKSRLTRERDEKINEIRSIKKAGGITALEMAQAIADVNSDYKKKISNI